LRVYEINSDGGVDALALAERTTPTPGPNEVLIRVRASSVNYRDLATIEDPVARNIPYPRIPNSDGAGEVVETGQDVTRFKPGDRVAATFFQRWIDGEITEQAMASALGGAVDGMLAEFVVLNENGLVAIPEHLSYTQAATLPCAGVTAWNCLVAQGGVTAGDTLLLLGTGGISITALQLATLLGARVIITSSSDEKLARAKTLGAWQTINYLQTPDWEHAVLDMTDGRGVDHTLEVGGAGTLEKSVAATRVAGMITLIGVLTGGQINPTMIMRKSIRLHGVYVGSRRMFEDLNGAIAHHRWKPVIDEVFKFEDAQAAYHAMRAAAHFGKLVIEI